MDYNYHIERAKSYMGKSIFYFFIGFLFVVIGNVIFFGEISFRLSETLVIPYILSLAFILPGLGLIVIVMNVEYKLRLPFRIFNKVKKKIGNYIESNNMLWEITMDEKGDIDLKQYPICPVCENIISIANLPPDYEKSLHTCSGCNNQRNGKPLNNERIFAMNKLNKERKRCGLYEPDRIVS